MVQLLFLHLHLELSRLFVFFNDDAGAIVDEPFALLLLSLRRSCEPIPMKLKQCRLAKSFEDFLNKSNKSFAWQGKSLEKSNPCMARNIVALVTQIKAM